MTDISKRAKITYHMVTELDSYRVKVVPQYKISTAKEALS